MTSEARPSNHQPVACFSEVASAWMSTTTTFSSGQAAFISARQTSPTRKGESVAAMKTCPCRFRTPTGIPAGVDWIDQPRPGLPGG